MVKKFTKKELERLNCNENDVSLVMKYQKLLPMPNEDFEMNARTLHKYLGVGKKVTTWIQGRIEKYGFKENIDFKMMYENDAPNSGNVDFTKFKAQELSRLGYRKEYYLTVNMCKELCTIENNELGKLARCYFILMERVLMDNKEWLEIRDPEKEEYKNMSKAVDSWCYRIWHHNASRSEFAVEADMINKIVTGKTSQELKMELGISTFDLLQY